MDSSIGVAFRAGAWNDKADELDNASNKIRQYDYMINYWLSPNAVLKFDYENQKYYTDGKGTSGINVGVDINSNILQRNSSRIIVKYIN